MKIARTLLFALLLPCLATAQQKYRAVTVMLEKHKINSGSRAAMGGRSRIVLPVKVPPRTKYLYYAISTSENDRSVTIKNGIKLATQIGKALQGTKVDVASMANAATTITGHAQDGNIDVFYIPDATQIVPFENKEDQRWRADMNNSRVNFSGGTVGIELYENMLQQVVYLGFRNPSSYKAQYFNIEVVALVRD